MTSAPHWLVPLYPFTIKLVYERFGNKGVDSGEFFNLTNTFVRDELQDMYNEIFYSVKLNWPESGMEDCISNQFAPVYSSRHNCVQSSASGYVLFDISNGEQLPSRDDLGNAELQLFRRGEESRENYLYMLANDAKNKNIQGVSDIYFTLNILSDGSGLIDMNDTSSKNGDLNVGLGDGSNNEASYTLNAISVAAIIAAGAVAVLVVSLFYAWRRKEWNDTRREAFDARSSINQMPSVTIAAHSTNPIGSNDMESIQNLEIVNSDSMMAMSTMDDYYSLNQHGTQSNTFQNDDDKDLASVVSMESYAFSFGEMENGSRSFAQRSVRFAFDDQTVDKSIQSKYTTEDLLIKQQSSNKIKSASSF